MEIIQNREVFYNGTHWNGAQSDYFEELMKSDDYMDQIVCARMGYGLDRLEKHENPAVRRVVALAGWASAELAKDPDVSVREAVVQNLAVVKVPYEIMDILLADEDSRVKIALIENGWGLKRFMKDDDPLVRAEVALKGYGAETLRFDDDAYVRGSVARALPKIEARNPELSSSIANQFAHDANWYVRNCLAETGYCKALLVNDPVFSVQEAAEKAPERIGIGSMVIDDDGFRGEAIGVHKSGMFNVSHECVNGRKVAADGWYPPERLKLDVGPQKVDDLISDAEKQAEADREMGSKLGKVIRQYFMKD